MAKLLVKNWREFQHYKDRSPSWIKLHKGLLDDYEYQRLPLASRALAPMLWLLASESNDGSVEYDIEKLAFRLRQTKKEIEDGIKPLVSSGFFVLEQDASTPLAEPERSASPEKRREEKRREETDDCVRSVFRLFVEQTGKNEKLYTLTDKRLSQGRKRFEEALQKTGGDTEAAKSLMLIAVSELVHSDYHMARGEYVGQTKYNDWENLFRSQEQFEKWLERSNQ